ncbi:unnamed protein product [Cunninghamella blakesleeana]
MPPRKRKTANSSSNNRRKSIEESINIKEQRQHVKNMKGLEPEDILQDSSMFQTTSPPIWKRKRFHFIIGLSVGLLGAFSASATKTTTDIQAYWSSLQLGDMNLANFLPANMLTDDIFNVTKYFTPGFQLSDDPFMPGLGAKEELDLKPHFPVVIVPGVISSGLESWSTDPKARKYFRKRMWGSSTMLQSVIMDKESWIQHVRLDPVTGLDPPGSKIRAAQGLDAADYFVSGYWIWGKIIENLAAIGYDSNNMYLASYDWRLAFYNLEVRDKYFTKLKAMIETLKATEGKKTVLLTHSMGSNLALYFFKWVESPHGGNGGDKWVNDHIETFVSLAGSFLGAPKSVAALLSGETRDTISIGSFGSYLLENFFSRQERANLLRTWAGGSSLLPKGGDTIWGSTLESPDDDDDEKENDNSTTTNNDENKYRDMDDDNKRNINREKGITDEIENMTKNTTTYKHTHGKLLSFLKRSSHKSSGLFGFNESDTSDEDVNNNTNTNTNGGKNGVGLDKHAHFTLDESLDLLLSTAPKEYANMLLQNYSTGIATSLKQLKKNNKDFTKWANPLESQLPTAPNMKIFCLYGVGLPTERSYHYTYADQLVSSHNCNQEQDVKSCLIEAMSTADFPSAEDDVNNSSSLPELPLLYIDTSVNDGVQFSDGDGTVPLLSLGYMCSPSNGGWTKHRDLYNPGHSPVVVKEYKHEQSGGFDVRGGSKSSDHVDILGNRLMTLDILKIISNKGDELTEQIYSNIEEVAKKVKLEPKP